MNLPFPELHTFIEDYNRILNIAQSKAIFVRGKELQIEQIIILDKLLNETNSLKDKSISEGLEEKSNFLLCLELAVEAVKNEFQLIISIKEDNAGKAWDFLIEAQNQLSLAIRNNPVNGDYLLNYANRMHLYEILLFPRMFFGSRGCVVGKTECSICHEAYGECDHIKGIAYMGKICCEIIHEIISIDELSLVENPADKGCRLISISDVDKKTLDFFTHREI